LVIVQVIAAAATGVSEKPVAGSYAVPDAGRPVCSPLGSTQPMVAA
jgi:hypothetical protein